MRSSDFRKRLYGLVLEIRLGMHEGSALSFPEASTLNPVDKRRIGLGSGPGKLVQTTSIENLMHLITIIPCGYYCLEPGCATILEYVPGVTRTM